MPKVARIRARTLRSDFTVPKFEDPKMSTSNTEAPTSKRRSPTLRNLVESLIFSLASSEKPMRLEGFEDELKCSECSNFLFHPVTALCGHSFCSKCAAEVNFCKHCEKDVDPSSFTKLNVTLDTIVEHWYPEHYAISKLVEEGDDLMKTGAFDAAKSKFTEVLKKNPYDIYSLMRRALALKEAGDWENAFANVVSAKVRTDCIPKEIKQNPKDFRFIAEQEELLVKKATKMFLEVMSLLHCNSETSSQRNKSSSHSPSNEKGEYVPENTSNSLGQDDQELPPENSFVSDQQIADLNSGLDSMIIANMAEFDFTTQASSSNSNEVKPRNLRLGSNDSDAFNELDFSCVLCTRPFHEPVCTPCGHTFCLGCLERCFDHGRTCPMCKTSLENIYQYQKCLLPVDWTLDAVIRKYFPSLCEEREALRQEERDKLREMLPVFVCITACPTVKCTLHIFEPRYRLMIRRAMRLHDGSFGITIPSRTSPFNPVGTIIKLKDVSLYQDGRSLITSVGTKRFEVEEFGTCDGYNTAKIKYIVDQQETDENRKKETDKIATEVYEKAKHWFFHVCTQEFRRRTRMLYGGFPEKDEIEGDNGPDWHWWVLANVPVEEEIKVCVLAKTSFRTRLAILQLIFQKLHASPPV